MRRLLIVLVLVGVCGCDADPLRKVDSANGSVTVELLTTFDDVRLYKVWTGGTAIYVAVHRDGTTAKWDEQDGKVTREVQVQTVGGR